MKQRKLTILIVIATIQLSACASTGTHSSVYYGAYYDPYPHWGRSTTVIIKPDNPDKPAKPDRPAKPPGTRPPGGIGQPGRRGGRR